MPLVRASLRDYAQPFRNREPGARSPPGAWPVPRSHFPEDSRTSAPDQGRRVLWDSLPVLPAGGAQHQHSTEQLGQSAIWGTGDANRAGENTRRPTQVKPLPFPAGHRAPAWARSVEFRDSVGSRPAASCRRAPPFGRSAEPTSSPRGSCPAKPPAENSATARTTSPAPVSGGAPRVVPPFGAPAGSAPGTRRSAPRAAAAGPSCPGGG